jgi:hypothetical protein
MKVLEIIFFLGLASIYINIPAGMPYREILIGLCALIIAVIKIVELLRS